MRQNLTAKIRKKILIPLAVATVLVVGGTFGYYLLVGGKASLFDCFYMVIITLATVGYGEVIPIEHNVPARVFTVILILFGMGTLLYVVTQLTAFFVEGDLTDVLRRARMNKRMDKMNDHVIVCGAGTTALHIVSELLHTRWDLIVIDPDPAQLAWIQSETESLRPKGDLLPHIQGDPSDDRVMLSAGIATAHGVVAAEEDDKDNLFITVTARQVCHNPRLRVIAQAKDTRSVPKLKAAGADSVISPGLIGGLRMVSEMIRPSVVTFLDIMLRDKDENLRVEEIQIGRSPLFVGKKISHSNLREHYNLLVLAVQEPGGRYIYKPKSDFVINEDMTLIVLGSAADVERLRKQLPSQAAC